MKIVAAVVVAVVIGFLLGGLGPRRELATAKTRADGLETDLAKASKKASRCTTSDRFNPFPDLGHVLPGPAPKATPSPVAKKEGDPSPEPEVSPIDRMAGFQLAVDAQRLRAKQSRAALLEKAHLDSKQQQSVDDIVSKMNDALGKHSAEIVGLMQEMDQGKDPDPVELLNISHDVSGILLDSQTAFGETVGDTPGLDDSARQVWNYVDLDIFRNVVENMPDNFKNRAPAP